MDPRDPIELDGGMGEGGGQILRTALSLSAVTGHPFRISRIRHGRMKPGLRPQHLAAARATAAICGGSLAGDSVGSAEISLEPRAVAPKPSWRFDIGTAGSAPLLFQTLCWPLALAGTPTQVSLLGGTHQDHSPSFHYLALVWAPAVARLGFPFDLTLQRAGFYPEGGGEFGASVQPARAMPPLDLRHRGTLLEADVVSLVSGVDFSVGERQADRAERGCARPGSPASHGPSPCRAARPAGATCWWWRASSGSAPDTPPRARAGGSPIRTADAAVAGFSRFLDGHGAVDRHLADQLLVPAALVAAGRVPRPAAVDLATRFTVGEVTRHLLTNAEVVQAVPAGGRRGGGSRGRGGHRDGPPGAAER